MKKICIIIPYYGQWPVYFDLFLKSCSFNLWMDVIFITDIDLPNNCPINVKKNHLSFNDLKYLVEKKLETTVALNSYYKLCDLKPMYGYVFNDFIKDYIFWGFGDIDLIYGNTKKFLTDEILKNHDIITFRTEWISGAFTLFRNNDYFNTLFKKSPDWLKVVSNEKHFSFTECAKEYNALLNGVSIFDINAEIISMTGVCKNEVLHGKLRYFEKKIIKESIQVNMYLEYERGNLRDNRGNEYLLYHYISDKPNPFFLFPKWKNIPEIFYITRTGFYTQKDFKYNFFIGKFRLLKKTRKVLNKLKFKLSLV